MVNIQILSRTSLKFSNSSKKEIRDDNPAPPPKNPEFDLTVKMIFTDRGADQKSDRRSLMFLMWFLIESSRLFFDAALRSARRKYQWDFAEFYASSGPREDKVPASRRKCKFWRNVFRRKPVWVSSNDSKEISNGRVVVNVTRRIRVDISSSGFLARCFSRFSWY